MSMEMIFVVTYLAVVLISIPIGLLTYWIFEKDNGNEE